MVCPGAKTGKKGRTSTGAMRRVSSELIPVDEASDEDDDGERVLAAAHSSTPLVRT